MSKEILPKKYPEYNGRSHFYQDASGIQIYWFSGGADDAWSTRMTFFYNAWFSKWRVHIVYGRDQRVFDIDLLKELE